MMMRIMLMTTMMMKHLFTYVVSVICCNSNSVLLEYFFCTLVVPVGNRLNSSGEPAEFQWRTGWIPLVGNAEYVQQKSSLERIPPQRRAGWVQVENRLGSSGEPAGFQWRTGWVPVESSWFKNRGYFKKNIMIRKWVNKRLIHAIHVQRKWTNLLFYRSKSCDACTENRACRLSIKDYRNECKQT